jgi:glycosyltransferase involved in cell wall biosynthesis
VKLTYFVNHYPKVSHSFIRREIRALEGQGFTIQRIALHGWEDPLPDPVDEIERSLTAYVQQKGALYILTCVANRILRSPVRFAACLALVWRMRRKIPGRSFLHHLAYLAEACVVMIWARQFGAKHLHAHFGTNSAEIAMFVRELGGPPFSVTIHGPEEFQSPIALEEKVARSRFSVAISSFGRSQLMLRVPHREWAKIKLIRCGVDRTFYEVPDENPRRNTLSRRLLCVGRLSPEKGQLLLVDAVAALAERGINLQVCLAGDGPMREEIARAIERARLSSQISITGWISSAEVRDEMLRSDGLVLPSFAEGLPVVIMEAMFLRKPVLSTYVAGIPELVVNGVTGWLIPAGSVEDLTRALESFARSATEELEALGDAGFNRVMQLHCAENEAARLGLLFQQGS